MKSSVINSHNGVQVAEKIEDAVKRVKTTFLQQKTKPMVFRLEQLRKLWCGYVLCVSKKHSMNFHRDILNNLSLPPKQIIP